jgi:hypothetical protein
MDEAKHDFHGLFSGRMEYDTLMVGIQLHPDSIGIVPYLRRAGLAKAGFPSAVRILDLYERRREHPGHWLAWFSRRKYGMTAPPPLLWAACLLEVSPSPMHEGVTVSSPHSFKQALCM